LSILSKEEKRKNNTSFISYGEEKKNEEKRREEKRREEKRREEKRRKTKVINKFPFIYKKWLSFSVEEKDVMILN